jgi:thiol-disulfide isomerase/thioredoxin
MKMTISILLAFVAAFASAQEKISRPPDRDPFLGFVLKMEDLNNFSFDATNRQKPLFSQDTVETSAHVTVGKTGDSITYFHILEKNTLEELLFYQDTGWFLPRERTMWKIAGTGIEQVKHSGLFYFLPINLITIKYNGEIDEPFWHVQSASGGLIDIKIDIREKPREISDLAVLIRIGETDSLLYGNRQVARFDTYGDTYYQELILEEYRFPEEDRFAPPASFLSIPRQDIALVVPPKEDEEVEEPEPEYFFLPDTGLTFISGEQFILPDSGLIFFDLWYTGCFPCMKSAPVIEEIHGEYKSRLNFFSINEIDSDTSKIQRYTAKMGLTFPVLLYRGPKLAVRVTGSNAYPVFIVIDAKSRMVLWHHSGFSDDLGTAIRKELEEILN